MSVKMLIHIGQGEDRKTYTFIRDRMMNVEAIAIERATGLTLLEVRDGLMSLSMTAVTAILWILRRREEPGLQFEDVNFELGDIEVELPDEEPEEPAAPKEAGQEDPTEPS